MIYCSIDIHALIPHLSRCQDWYSSQHFPLRMFLSLNSIQVEQPTLSILRMVLSPNSIQVVEQPVSSIENNFTRKVATTVNRTEVYCYKKEKGSVIYIQFGKLLSRQDQHRHNRASIYIYMLLISHLVDCYDQQSSQHWLLQMLNSIHRQNKQANLAASIENNF